MVKLLLLLLTTRVLLKEVITLPFNNTLVVRRRNITLPFNNTLVVRRRSNNFTI
jgi:hypothetical protein